MPVAVALTGRLTRSGKRSCSSTVCQPECINMSDTNPLVNIDGGSDHDELIGKEMEVIHVEMSQMTTIHSEFTSTALRRDDEGC